MHQTVPAVLFHGSLLAVDRLSESFEFWVPAGDASVQVAPTGGWNRLQPAN